MNVKSGDCFSGDKSIGGQIRIHDKGQRFRVTAETPHSLMVRDWHWWDWLIPRWLYVMKDKNLDYALGMLAAALIVGFFFYAVMADFRRIVDLEKRIGQVEQELKAK